MRNSLIVWILLAPVAVLFLSGFLAAYGLPDFYIGVIAVVLLLAYLGGLIKIGLILAGNPATPFDMYFGEKGLSIKRFRLFGREYTGDWNGKAVRIRYEFGLGGIAARLIVAFDNEGFSKILEPASVKEINAWLS